MKDLKEFMIEVPALAQLRGIFGEEKHVWLQDKIERLNALLETGRTYVHFEQGSTKEEFGFFIPFPLPEPEDSADKLIEDIANLDIIYDWFQEFKARARKLKEKGKS